MITMSYTSLRANLADALERVESGETIEITRQGHQPVVLAPKHINETKSVTYISKDKFNASLKRIQKKHAKNIQALADR